VSAGGRPRGDDGGGGALDPADLEEIVQLPLAALRGPGLRDPAEINAVGKQLNGALRS
jgi:hypothetical protein